MNFKASKRAAFAAEAPHRFAKGPEDGSDNVVALPAVGPPRPIDVRDIEAALQDFARFRKGEAVSPSHPSVVFRPDGLHILDAQFSFPLILSSRRLPFRLCFYRCRFDDVVDVRWMRCDGLTFEECTLSAAFKGMALTTAGNVDFSGSRSHAQIDLAVAVLRGDLILVGAELACDDDIRAETVPDVRRGAALFCGGLQVHSVLMDRIKTKGRIFLNAAKLTGILKAAGAELRRDPELEKLRLLRWSHVVLSATDTDIQGAVIFGEESDVKPVPQDSFLACGQINLSNSRIGGDLICTNGKFHSAYYGCEACELDPFDGMSDSPKKEPEKVVLGAAEPERKDLHEPVLLAALNVSRTKIEGGVWLDRKFEAFGEVRFDGAEIKGAFRAEGATINGALPACEDGAEARRKRYHSTLALNLEHAEIEGMLFLNGGFNAFGLVTLRNARVRSDIMCDDSTFHACWRRIKEDRLGRDEERQPMALVFSGARIDGSVFLACKAGAIDAKSDEVERSLLCGPDRTPPRKCFRAFGQVRLRGTEIKRNLHLGGGRFELMPPPDEGKPGAGPRRSRGRRKQNDDCELPLLGWFHSAKVEGSIFLTEVDRLPVCFNGSVSFADVTTGGWEDSVDCWPRSWGRGKQGKATLELNGLTYKALRGPTAGEERVIWLLHQPDQDLSRPRSDESDYGFKTQPWEQCASVLYEMGYQRDARFLYRMEQRFIRVKDRLSWTSQWLSVLLGMFVGHGYRFFYTLLWAIWLMSIGAAISDYGYQKGYVVETERLEGVTPYPEFHPLLFSLDTALPAGDLRQTKFWVAVDHRAAACPDGGVPPHCKAPNPVVPKIGSSIGRILAWLLGLAGVPAWLGQLSAALSELVAISLLTFLFARWLTRDIRMHLRDGDAFTRRDARRLYASVLNSHRGPARFLPIFGVCVAVVSFPLVWGLYLFDEPDLFALFDWVDGWMQGELGVSLVHAWMSLETLLGWLLISAVIIGLGAVVFRHPD